MVDKKSILLNMEKNAKENGYYLCPDKELLNLLLDGLVTNENRYGYGSCPCRMSSGTKNYDVDIICPCEYRDADVNEFGMCYCGLFVDEKLKNDPAQMQSIPERRPIELQDIAMTASQSKGDKAKSKQDSSLTAITEKSSEIPIWRCTVCGYLCARELPPPICPICKAKAERFEKFNLG